MNTDSLRLYLDSVIRLHNGTNPATLSDEEVAGVIALLPKQAVGYAEWSEKLGLTSAEDKEPEKMTEETAGEINDAALRHLELLELERNGRNTDN
jgi:hypothetical protein